MLKFVVPGVLVLALVVLSWMSLLRVDNLAHDVAALRHEVDELKRTPGTAPGPGSPAPTPAPAAPAGATGSQAPPTSTVPTTMAAAPSPSGPEVFEATLQAYFSSSSPGPQRVRLPLPSGTVLRGVDMVVLAVEGDGTAPVPLPAPQPRLVLEPGVPQSLTGLCQGPENAAWVFTLQGTTVTVESRDCLYPVRGLRPHLRLSALR